MVRKILAKSIFGWNRYLTGTHAQRLIACMICGGICGGTKTALEIIFGIDKRKKEREELEKLREEKALRELDELLRQGLRDIDFNIKMANETQKSVEDLLNQLED